MDDDKNVAVLLGHKTAVIGQLRPMLRDDFRDCANRLLTTAQGHAYSYSNLVLEKDTLGDNSALMVLTDLMRESIETMDLFVDLVKENLQ